MQWATLLAAPDLSSQLGRATLEDGLEGSLLTGQGSQAGANLRSGGAQNVRHFQHEGPLGAGDRLEVLSECLQRIDQLSADFGRQMSVNRRRAGIAMA